VYSTSRTSDARDIVHGLAALGSRFRRMLKQRLSLETGDLGGV
jgi:hypothetical protein